MSMWDELPQPVRDSGSLDGVRPLLDDLTATGPTEQTDADGTWRVWTADQNLTGPLPSTHAPVASGRARGRPAPPSSSPTLTSRPSSPCT